MTREIIKLDFNYWNKPMDRGSDVNIYFERKRILNPDIAEFFWNCCKMERLK